MEITIHNNNGQVIETNFGTIINQAYMPTSNQQEQPDGEEPESEAPSVCGIERKTEIPAELTTAQAKMYWERLQVAGFIDEEYQLCQGVSRKEAMLIALHFSEKLGLSSKWKPFEQLWDKHNLAQEKYGMEETGLMPKKHKEIAALFED